MPHTQLLATIATLAIIAIVLAVRLIQTAMRYIRNPYRKGYND